MISGPEEGSGGSEAQFSAGLQWHQWRAQDLALLLAVSLQLPASDTATHFTLAFNYFDHVRSSIMQMYMYIIMYTMYEHMIEAICTIKVYSRSPESGK